MHNTWEISPMACVEEGVEGLVMVRWAVPDGGEVRERGVQHGVGSIQLLLPPLPPLLLIVQGGGGAKAGAAAVHLQKQLSIVTYQH
jgi:hypothetical protein